MGKSAKNNFKNVCLFTCTHIQLLNEILYIQQQQANNSSPASGNQMQSTSDQTNVKESSKECILCKKTDYKNHGIVLEEKQKIPTYVFSETIWLSPY